MVEATIFRKAAVPRSSVARKSVGTYPKLGHIAPRPSDQARALISIKQVTTAGVLVWAVPDYARVVGNGGTHHRMGRQNP